MKTEKKFDVSQFSHCDDNGSREYYESKPSFEAAWNDCERGDWMLWIACELNIDIRILTRAKALCANTVRLMMKDKRSTEAINAALRYANGKIDETELYAVAKAQGRISAVSSTAAANADDSEDRINIPAAYAEAYAAACADEATAYATCVYTYAVYVVDASVSASYYAAYAASKANRLQAGAAAKKANLLQTADVCREVLTDAVFQKIKEIQNKGYEKSKSKRNRPKKF